VGVRIIFLHGPPALSRGMAMLTIFFASSRRLQQPSPDVIAVSQHFTTSLHSLTSLHCTTCLHTTWLLFL
jgi:hypothetical protein